jgi:CheY-like chemotaxis protein
MTFRPVLYVEDSEDDQFFMRRAFARAAIQNPLSIAAQAEEAMACLTKADFDPCLILIDLKLPGMSGPQLLRWIRGQEGRRHVPVVALAMTEAERDLLRASDLGADNYLVKPPTETTLRQLAETLNATFWPGAPDQGLILG